MSFDLKSWFTSVTTGGGVAGLLTVATAYMTHAMTWETALPMVLGSLYLIVHPEDNSGAATIESVTKDAVAATPTFTADANALITAFKQGMEHKVNLTVVAATPQVAAQAPVVVDPNTPQVSPAPPTS